jgi:aspartate carbamoyltransferase regulatory subunit
MFVIKPNRVSANLRWVKAKSEGSFYQFFLRLFNGDKLITDIHLTSQRHAKRKMLLRDGKNTANYEIEMIFCHSPTNSITQNVTKLACFKISESINKRIRCVNNPCKLPNQRKVLFFIVKVNFRIRFLHVSFSKRKANWIQQWNEQHSRWWFEKLTTSN